ncbi:LLM class flavin-dependent oxidoreductase [Sediminivirga luteola]|uniref:Luciferase-like monooxygenase n=1 Tax=Sediminivirga luteola TaxID=1774748 RepID=A0A8J2XJZ1_9MICO|nr:LLM class flavin-dependent oxidoreductase [Sediminivirga luteola]MCI2265469.1 LLM class flavin-dependent oxidoreductase [Sediminivirga luteola]GGA10391.1 hypothetical protein GCM10011333_11390 [Sediminivirga luteola]
MTPWLIEPSDAELEALAGQLAGLPPAGAGSRAEETAAPPPPLETLERSGAAALVLRLPPGSGLSALPLAGMVLARTVQARVLVVPDLRTHPVNLARTVSTLAALHEGRIGVLLGEGGEAGTGRTGGAEQPRGSGQAVWYDEAPESSAPLGVRVLRALSALWESWPLEALTGDTVAGRYVDDARLGRVTTPGLPDIGGPLTLPTDMRDKPVLIWEGTPGDYPWVDLQLRDRPLPRRTFAEAARHEGAPSREDAPVPERPVPGGAPPREDAVDREDALRRDGAERRYAASADEGPGFSSAAPRTAGTLRWALGLPAAPPSGGDWAPAFPPGEGNSLQASR